MPINVLSPCLYHFIKTIPDKTINVYFHKLSFVFKLAERMPSLEEEHKKFKTNRLVIFCQFPLVLMFVLFIFYFKIEHWQLMM